MNTLKKTILVLGMSVLSFGGISFIATIPVAAAPAPTTPTPAAAASPSQCSQSFLTFPTWYRGLVAYNGGACDIVAPKTSDGLSAFIWHIVLNVIEIGLQVVAYLAAGFILWGGFLYLTSQGSADVAAKARKTIFDAVIGLGISIASIAVINLLSGILIH